MIYELTEDEVKSLKRLCAYMADSEKTHYQEQPTKDHIYHDVVKLRKILKGGLWRYESNNCCNCEDGELEELDTACDSMGYTYLMKCDKCNKEYIVKNISTMEDA